MMITTLDQVFNREYLLFNEVKPVRWKKLLYFDIETVETIEEMRKVKELPIEEQLKYLDVRNAKYLAYYIPVSDKLLGVSILDFKKMNYERMADYLIQTAFEHGVQGLCAHNGKRFDFLIFKLAGYKISERKGTYILHVGRRTLTLVDTITNAKLLGSPSLDDLAQKLGVGSKNLEEAETLKEYALNDVLTLYKVAMKFAELKLDTTPTRTARIYISKELNRKGISRLKADFGYYDYSGGRVEPFKGIVGSGYCYDANSLYPSVMAKMLFPEGIKSGRTFKIRIRKVNDANGLKNYIDAKLNEVWSSYPKNPFELLSRFNDVFKVGYSLIVRIKGADGVFREFFPFSYLDDRQRWRCYEFKENNIYNIVGYEILWLYFFDYEILDAYSFKLSKHILADMYEELYRERMRLKSIGDDRQMHLKIVMNSSYGIMGLRDEREFEAEDSVLESGFWLKMTENRFFERITGVYYSDGKLKGRFWNALSIPPYAVHTTSNARFWLYATMLYIMNEGYDVYYCDTDSVFTDAPPEVLKKLGLLGSDMLKWKHEYTFSKATFIAPKTYAVLVNNEVKLKAKGVGNKPEKIFIVQSIKNPEPKVMSKIFINPFTPCKKIYNAENNTFTYNTKDYIPASEGLKELFSNIPEEFSLLREVWEKKINEVKECLSE